MGLDADRVWKEAEDLMGDLADADGDESEIAEAVAQFLDALVPLNIILPGVAGIAAESVDDEVFRKVVDLLVDLFRVDPDKRAARREKRQTRRAERRERRERRRDA